MNSAEVMSILQPRPLAASKPDREAPKPSLRDLSRDRSLKLVPKVRAKVRISPKGETLYEFPMNFWLWRKSQRQLQKVFGCVFGFNLKRC